MITKTLKEIKAFLGDKDSDSLEFSLDLEVDLLIRYKEMYAESPYVTVLMTEELPEICAIMEPGLDDTEFRALMRREYDMAVEAYDAVKNNRPIPDHLPQFKSL